MSKYDFDKIQEEIWGDGRKSPHNDRCIYATRFSEWALHIIPAPPYDQSMINHALISLFMKYFELRQVVPKTHKNRVGPAGHDCIFSVLEEYFYVLMQLQALLYIPVEIPEISERKQPAQPPDPPGTLVIAEIRGTYG
jgi:hypothetical protein